jgi:hypothetical protein
VPTMSSTKIIWIPILPLGVVNAHLIRSPQGSCARYRTAFPNARLSRKGNGVLEVRLHTDGAPAAHQPLYPHCADATDAPRRG